MGVSMLKQYCCCVFSIFILILLFPLVSGEVSYSPKRRSTSLECYQWALENIMKNALDAMDKEEGIINIRIGSCLNGCSAFIEIEDNGRGIGEKDIKRIFKPGYSTKKRGWGLGLSLAKRIVEEYHKGKLFVKESKFSIGTVMRIEL